MCQQFLQFFPDFNFAAQILRKLPPERRSVKFYAFWNMAHGLHRDLKIYKICLKNFLNFWYFFKFLKLFKNFLLNKIKFGF